MAASVRIDSEARTDPRFELLGRHVLSEWIGDEHASSVPPELMASLGLGLMARLWGVCTDRNKYVLDVEVCDLLLRTKNSVKALSLSDLGEVVSDGIRIRGTKGRIEWHEKLKKAGKKGAKKRWKGGHGQAIARPKPGHKATPSQPHIGSGSGSGSGSALKSGTQNPDPFQGSCSGSPDETSPPTISDNDPSLTKNMTEPDLWAMRIAMPVDNEYADAAYLVGLGDDDTPEGRKARAIGEKKLAGWKLLQENHDD